MHESRKKFILSVCFANDMRIWLQLPRSCLCKWTKNSFEKSEKESLQTLQFPL